MTEKQTAVEEGVFKGHKTVSVWEVDPAGNRVGKTPVISFGINKAIAVLRHAEQIKKAFNLTDADIANG